MPEKRLYAKLAATSAVTALVTATKIQPVKVPQSLSIPLITYERSGSDPVNHATGTTTTASCIIEIDIYDDDYGDCKAIADAVRAALSGWSDATDDPQVSMCHLQDEMDLPLPPEAGQDLIVHHVNQTYLLWYNST